MNDRTVSLPPIQLPEPVKWKAIPLFAALEQRRTTREISDTALSEQQLANLLWAAFGVNRKTGPFGLPGRTAASASNSQEIDIYVALRDGVYLYNALDNRLEPLIAEDLRVRALTPGQQDIPSVAPVQLIFVADIDRMTHMQGFEEPGLHDPEIQKAYYYVDTGLIAGNVYLFAADQALAAWFHNCDRTVLAERLGLRTTQRVLFAQSVGYPVLQ